MSNCRATVPVTKTCQACGAEFACLGSCCWCSEIPVNAATRASLTAQFSDCLCPPCLEAAAAAHRDAPPPASAR